MMALSNKEMREIVAYKLFYIKEFMIKFLHHSFILLNFFGLIAQPFLIEPFT